MSVWNVPASSQKLSDVFIIILLSLFFSIIFLHFFFFFFFFNDTPPTEISPLSLHDALPISVPLARPAHHRTARRSGEPPAQRRPCVLRRESAHQPHQRVRAAQHVRLLLLRAHAAGGGRVYTESRRGLRRGRRGADLVETPCIRDRKSTRLNSSHGYISYAVFC